MQARLCGSEGNVKGGRHVGHLEVEAEPKHQKRSILLTQTANEPLNLIPSRDVAGFIGQRHWLQFAKRDRGVAVATPPVQFKGRVERHSPEPRQPPIGVAKSRKLAPGANECLLRGVLGVMRVAEYREGEPIGVARFEPHQGLKGFPVAVSSRRYQILLRFHHTNTDAPTGLIRSIPAAIKPDGRRRWQPSPGQIFAQPLAWATRPAAGGDWAAERSGGYRWGRT